MLGKTRDQVRKLYKNQRSMIFAEKTSSENLMTKFTKQNTVTLPPARGFLLTMGSYQGTLAAARDLGKSGIPVVLIDSQNHTLTAASRYITQIERAPDVEDHENFIAWLLKFGEENPGYVLYPTSDDMCWIIATQQERLKQFFYLFQPPEASTYSILNKEKLFRLCQKLRIDCPETIIPKSPDDYQAIVETANYPVLVKPKTQAGMTINLKGVICHSPNDLLKAIASIKSRFFYKQAILDYDPDLECAIVQRFYKEAAEHIYSLAGFFDPETDTYVVRASEKVLQIPLQVGVGLCFESREVYEKPAQQLRRLLKAVGYQGAFEAEFIHLEQENRFLLIDLNSRFYGQMGFEINRNLPIARLCYFAAIGDFELVRQLAAQAQDWNHSILYKYRLLWMLRFLVTTKWLGGNMSRNQRKFWLDWSSTGTCYDPIYTADDPKPLKAYILDRFLTVLKYPRSSFRIYF